MATAGPPDNDALAVIGAAAEDTVRSRVSQLTAAGGIVATPVRTLVQAQLAALLCTLDAVREHYRPARPRPSAPRA
jgi:hypothetical protein